MINKDEGYVASSNGEISKFSWPGTNRPVEIVAKLCNIIIKQRFDHHRLLFLQK